MHKRSIFKKAGIESFFAVGYNIYNESEPVGKVSRLKLVNTPKPSQMCKNTVSSYKFWVNRKNLALKGVIHKEVTQNTFE